MLLQLSIRDIALIDRLTLSFGPGLTVLTGETGAGKSIIVGSLDFVLGGKADRDRIAGGAERGRVEALFDISALPRVQSALAEMGLETEDGGGYGRAAARGHGAAARFARPARAPEPA